MVSEEKKQFKELVSRLKGTDKQESQAQRLGSSQTLRNLWEMTGQSVDPSTYQMSTVQDQSSPSNKLSSGTTLSTGKKRTRSDTTSSSEDGTAPSSPMTHKSTASTLSPKDLFCLMGTLNSCFGPAYDFMSARSDEFCLEPELWLIKHYISRFCSIYADKYEALAPRLWKSIDDEITPSQCVVYSYRPDHLSDPYSTGCLASFNYFFYNKSLKRVLFFSFRVLNDPVVTDIDDEEGTQDLF